MGEGVCGGGGWVREYVVGEGVWWGWMGEGVYGGGGWVREYGGGGWVREYVVEVDG